MLKYVVSLKDLVGFKYYELVVAIDNKALSFVDYEKNELYLWDQQGEFQANDNNKSRSAIVCINTIEFRTK